MWRRIAKGHKGMTLECILAVYRELDESVSSNAGRMLEHSLRVLDKAFADHDLPWQLRQRAYANLHFDASLEYRGDSYWKSLRELLYSLVIWPLPLHLPIYTTAMRMKALAYMILKGWQTR